MNERDRIEDIDAANRVIAELDNLIAWIFTGNPNHAVTCDGNRLVKTSTGWSDWETHQTWVNHASAEFDNMIAQGLDVPTSIVQAMGADPWLSKGWQK